MFLNEQVHVIGKDEWPPNLPFLNPVDYDVGLSMLERYRIYTPKRTNIAELKISWRYEMICDMSAIDKAIVSFLNRLRSCVAAAGKHFEHSV